MKQRIIVSCLVSTVAIVAAAFGAPRPTPLAQAATCAQHANQAAAQRAGDTRDADHDGLYCVISPR